MSATTVFPASAHVQDDVIFYEITGRELVRKLQQATTSQRDAIRGDLRAGTLIVIDDDEQSVGDLVRIVRRTAAWAEWIEQTPWVSPIATPPRRNEKGRPGNGSLDRRLSNVDQVLRAMREGRQLLHLEYENGRPLWTLSSGRNVAAHAAALVIGNASIVPAGDSLFPDSPSQTWRYVQ